MKKNNAQANTQKSKAKKRFRYSTKEITPGKARYLSTMLKDYEPPVGKTPKHAVLLVSSKHFTAKKESKYSMNDAGKALKRNLYYEEGSDKSVFAHVREMITVEADQADIVSMSQFTQKKLENEHKQALLEKLQLTQQKKPRYKKAA